MPLDFPTSPTNGQVYDQWQWDGAKWVAIVGTLPAGPAGPTGPPGVSAGRIFYYDATDASDIAGYAKLLASPSANPEKTIAVACTGVGVDFAVEEFASDPGVPGAVDYPAGTAYRRIYAHVNSGTARLHLRIYIRTAAGVETLVRDEVSPDFTDQTVALQEWVASAPAGGAMLATDRIVNKLSAQRVTGGGGTVTVTCHFEGTTTGSRIQTTIATGGSLAGMIAGQIPIAASATAISSSANLSGDITSAPTTLATTLATVNANVGTFQGLTLDAKGRVTAAANQSYVTGGPYLPTAGGVLTGSITLTPNNVAAVKGVEVGGTPRNLIFMGSDNTVYVGEGANSIQLWATALSTTSHLDLSNNNSLRGKDTGGIARQLTTLAADNVIYLGDGARTIVTNCGAGNQLFNTGAASKPGGGVWSDSSDARLKRSVVDYGRGLAAVVQLRPVYFEFNGLADTPTDGKTFVGLVADEVEPVMPEMVGTRSALLHPEDAEPVDVKTLDCTALLFALVNSARELADRVAELEARMPPGLPIIDERH